MAPEYFKENLILLCFRTKIPGRHGARRLAVKGIFPGAEVIRGRDWKWEDQDGEYIHVVSRVL